MSVLLEYHKLSAILRFVAYYSKIRAILIPCKTITETSVKEPYLEVLTLHCTFLLTKDIQHILKTPFILKWTNILTKRCLLKLSICKMVLCLTMKLMITNLNMYKAGHFIFRAFWNERNLKQTFPAKGFQKPGLLPLYFTWSHMDLSIGYLDWMSRIFLGKAVPDVSWCHII